MEQFDSDKQVGLFNAGPEEFLSGLGRAFTLASDKHFTGGREVLHRGFANETVVANFTNANGETFVVTVEKR